jgi:hypothetical protein
MDVLTVAGEAIEVAELQAIIERMPLDRQRAVAVFFKIIRTLAVVKGADYGSDEDTFLNYELTGTAFGDPAWHVVSERIGEKLVRIGNLVRQDREARRRGETVTPRSESFNNSFEDLCWMSAIAIALRSRTEVARAVVTLERYGERPSGSG